MTNDINDPLGSIELFEAFHVRGTHWIPTPESGACPMSHPNKLQSPEGESRCYTDSAAAALKRSKMSEQKEPLETQVIILSKERFDTIEKAREWMEKSDFSITKIDETDNTWRFRQFNPDQCIAGSFSTFPITDGVQGGGCRVKPELQEQIDPPKNARNLDANETLAAVAERGSKFTQQESGYKAQADSPEKVCGTCRFYLRSPDSEIGACQVVEGDIPWFATSDFYISADDEAKAIFEEALIQEGVRPAFGSTGGKKLLAKEIVSYIPEHKNYVEPFIGGGAVFFRKKPSERESINDLNGDIANAYQFMKSMNEGNKAKLAERILTFDRDHFFKLRDSNPTSQFDRFYRFLYLNAYSFGTDMRSTVRDASGIGMRDLAGRLKRIMEKVKPRLENVAITSEDFRILIARENTTETFFYLDPPYPEQQANLKTDLTNADIFEAVRKIKGKFILSLPETKSVIDTFKEFHIKKVQVRRSLENRAGRAHMDGEVLISNFPLVASSTWITESVMLWESFTEMNYFK